MLGLLPGNSLAADYEYSGDLTTSQTWLSSDTHLVTGDARIYYGVTITIEPGTTVRFAPGTHLEAEGKLIADGDVGSEITFTSQQASPNAGDWDGIKILNNSRDSVLDHVRVLYAGGEGQGALYLGSNYLTVSNVTVQHSAYHGIDVAP